LKEAATKPPPSRRPAITQPDKFVTELDEVMRESLGRVIAAQDAVLLRRSTYDDWAAFWPTSDIEPFASFINGVQKFVLTSTPPALGWPESKVIEHGLSDPSSTSSDSSSPRGASAWEQTLRSRDPPPAVLKPQR
jgi:hypothetical protein